MKAKETMSRFIVNEKSILWQSHKIQWDSPTEKLKDMCGSPYTEKGVTFTQKKENMVQRVYDICDSHKYMLSSFTYKTETSKDQTGKQVFVT